MKKIFNKEDGFTIIEVVLVLAIAGLIFLVVFLALPQLQRSRRDTQRKSDVGRVVAGLESYSGNNSGNYPVGTDAGFSSFVAGYITTGGTDFSDPSGGAYALVGGSGTTVPDTSDGALGTMYYRTSASCGATEGTFVSGTTRDVAVLTPLEGGIAFCQDNQ